MKTSRTCTIRFLATDLSGIAVLHRAGNHRNVAIMGPMTAEESVAANAAAKAMMMRDRPTDYMVSVDLPPIFIPIIRNYCPRGSVTSTIGK